MRDGVTICNEYGCDLESLSVGCTVGVKRTCHGQLVFFVNGVEQGVACEGIAPGT